MSTTGKLYGSGQVCGSFAYTWLLQDFSKLPSAYGNKISSGCFEPNGGNITKLFIELYPEGKTVQDDQFVSVFLRTKKESNEKDVNVKFAATFRTSTGKKVHREETEYWEHPAGESIGWSQFIDRKSLLPSLVDDILVVFVEVEYSLTFLTDKRGKISHAPEPSFAIASTECALSALDSGKHSDVTIRAEETDVPAHKFVLASRSDVFAAMFEHDTIEKATQRIDVTDFDLATVKSMLRFMYSGQVKNMDVSLALELLRAADKYDLEDLTRYCTNFLATNMDEDNIGQILVAADMYQACHLRKEAVSYFCKSLRDVHFNKHRPVLKERPELLCDIINRIAEI